MMMLMLIQSTVDAAEFTSSYKLSSICKSLRYCLSYSAEILQTEWQLSLNL